MIFPRVILWQLSPPSLLVFPLIYILEVYFIDKAPNAQIKIDSLMIHSDICRLSVHPNSIFTAFGGQHKLLKNQNVWTASTIYILFLLYHSFPCIVFSLLGAHLTISRYVHQLLSYRLTVCHIIMIVIPRRKGFFCLQLNTNSFFFALQ